MGGRRFAAVALLSFGCNVALAASQPDILFILADDIGAEASSLYPRAGVHGVAPMPSIGKLAALDGFKTTRDCVLDPAGKQP